MPSGIASLAGRLRGVRYNLIDLGIACEHLVLQATAEGVGSCWFGWFDTRAVKRVLALPRGMQIDILIALGYPADDAPEAIVDGRGYRQVSDPAALDALIDQVLLAQPNDAADASRGRGKALSFLIGKVMQASAGRANPKMIRELLVTKLQATL